MLYISRASGRLCLRELTEDDDVTFDHPQLVGGHIISSLQSSAAGTASSMLAETLAIPGPMCVVACAESGDHERLKRLYARFGFAEACGSLMIRE